MNDLDDNELRERLGRRDWLLSGKSGELARLEAIASEESYIAACEIVGPNSLDFNNVQEVEYDNILEQLISGDRS